MGCFEVYELKMGIPKEIVLRPYQHDCDHCIWVGWVECSHSVNNWGNMYFCPYALTGVVDNKGLSRGSVIVRYGNRPPEYLSMPVGVCTKGSLGIRI